MYNSKSLIKVQQMVEDFLISFISIFGVKDKTHYKSSKKEKVMDLRIGFNLRRYVWK